MSCQVDLIYTLCRRSCVCAYMFRDDDTLVGRTARICAHPHVFEVSVSSNTRVTLI